MRPRGPTRARRGRPQRAATALPGSLKELARHLPEDERRLAEVWDRAVGPRVAARAQPRRLVRGTLVVEVQSSAWLSELSFLKSELAARLNQALGAPAQPVVKELRLVLADGGTAARGRLLESDRPRPPAPPVDLAPFEGELAQVADEELRERIRRALAAGLAAGQEATPPAAAPVRAPGSPAAAPSPAARRK
jgi:hypothetical protein